MINKTNVITKPISNAVVLTNGIEMPIYTKKKVFKTNTISLKNESSFSVSLRFFPF